MLCLSKEETYTDKFKVIFSLWKITKPGRKYLDFIDKKEDTEQPNISSVSLVHVIPQRLEEKIQNMGIQLGDILEDLISSAEAELIIASPYIGETMIPLLRKVNKDVDVKILTHKRKPFLTRLVDEYENIQLRTLKKVENGVQLYQIHAKFICIDKKYSLIGSFNLNERSIYHNFEMGVLIENEKISSNLKEIFDSLYKLSS